MASRIGCLALVLVAACHGTPTSAQITVTVSENDPLPRELSVSIYDLGGPVVQNVKIAHPQFPGVLKLVFPNSRETYRVVVLSDATSKERGSVELTTIAHGQVTARVEIGTGVADSDEDGVPDALDNCPTIANATQSDDDRDGKGNDCAQIEDTDLASNPTDAAVAGDAASDLATDAATPSDLAGADMTQLPDMAHLTYPQVVLADSPYAYWRLGETAGTTAVDLVGSHHGTYNAHVTLGQTGLLTNDADKAAFFTVNTGTTEQLNAPSVAVSGNPFTASSSIEAIIQVTANSPANLPGGLMYAEIYNTNGFRSGVDSSRRLKFWSNESGGSSSLTNSTQLSLSTPYHVVFTYTVTNAQSFLGTLILYLNGNSVATVPNFVIKPPTGSIELGYIEGVGSLGGVLDEVAFYSSVLNATQVHNHAVAAGLAP